MKTKNRTRFSNVILGFFFAVLTIGFSACSSSDDEMDQLTDTKDTQGTAAPDFSLTALDGSTVNLKSYENKVLVMFFFGNTCPACKAAAPSIQSKIADIYASNKDFAIIGLDQWNGNKASVEAFKSTTGIDFTLLLDASKVSSDYNTTYDRLIVVDKEGKIRFKGAQGASKDINDVLSTINTYL